MNKEFIKQVVKNILNNNKDDVNYYGVETQGVIEDQFDEIADNISEELNLH